MIATETNPAGGEDDADIRLQVQERMDVKERDHDFKFIFGHEGDDQQVNSMPWTPALVAGPPRMLRVHDTAVVKFLSRSCPSHSFSSALTLAVTVTWPMIARVKLITCNTPHPSPTRGVVMSDADV